MSSLEICSRDFPLVSGTAKKIKITDRAQTALKITNVQDTPMFSRISRKVSETIRLVPQLSTVAREMALPLTEAGKISLRINQDTGPKLNPKAATYNMRAVKAAILPTVDPWMCT